MIIKKYAALRTIETVSGSIYQVSDAAARGLRRQFDIRSASRVSIFRLDLYNRDGEYLRTVDMVPDHIIYIETDFEAE